MSGFASSLLNRIHDLVGINATQTSSSLVPSFNGRFPATGASSLSTLTAPACVHNQQDRRIIEKCYRAMETVIRLCRQPALNLKKSPPCILDILPEIYSLLDTIFTANGEILQNNLFLQLFLANLTAKCKQTIRIFKDERAKIFEENSKGRRSLTMKSLIFSHMHSDLQSQFPSNGQFIGQKFRITKKEAAEFWSSAFGNKTIVPWEDFRNELSKVHQIGIGIETHALKSTIDLTCNDYISNYEFDVFTRLFQPWNTLLKNWQILAVTHPAYVAFLTYEDVKQKLQQFINKPGSYVFRLSCTKLGQWAIGYVAPDRKIYQTIPQSKSLIQSLVDGSREGFYLYPNGRNKNVDLSHALQSHPEGRMKVTSEQYQIYCEMGTTFEMCKICDERNKNVRMEPCGHLLCRPCMNSWQDSVEGGSTCPFCRCEIKGTENVVIDSFNLRSRSSSALAVLNPQKEKRSSIEKAELLPSQSTSTENLMTFSPQKDFAPLFPTSNNTGSPPRMPPPIPPKRLNSPPCSVTQLPSTSSSQSLARLDQQQLPSTKSSDSDAEIAGTSAKSEETGVNNNEKSPICSEADSQSPSFDPFASMLNPFAERSSQACGGREPGSSSANAADNQLPQFQDFMSMEFNS